MSKRAILMCLALAGCASEPQADKAPSPWPEMTRMDVEMAYQMLSEDHPAMSKRVNDKNFQQNLEQGRLTALERASQVSSFEGYLATMSGLANSAGDKHVWSRTPYKSKKRQWAGLVVSRQGDSYIVVNDETADSKESLVGAELVSCDKLPVADFARDKLGAFSAVWSVEAQRIQKAPYLLIDNGNPFVLRPEACRFQLNGAVVKRELDWQPVKNEALLEKLGPARNRGAAGHGVKEFEGGYWIALQTLGKKAVDVVAAVRSKERQLRKANIVVLDMRGNGGGNSRYGDEIANVLFGQNKPAGQASSCDSVWRVSPRNLKQMNYYVEHFAKTVPGFVAQFKPKVALAEAAYEKGDEFTGPTRCAESQQPMQEQAKQPEPVLKGRVVLLTDNTCFSSCLIVTDKFRKLGALHVGQSTDANTHYMEVREDLMPSGLSYFSTLQAMSPSSPVNYGPFVPDVAYNGEIADTASLEKWILEITSTVED